MFSRRAGPPQGEGSWIAGDAVVTGHIVSAGSLRVDGRVDGDVRCARLVQGASGAVHGNIVADEARLAGLVDGAVEAGALVLDATARVTGDILYESLGIAPGAEVEGRFRRRKGPADHGAAAAREEAARTEPGDRAAVDAPAAEAARPKPAERTPRRPAKPVADAPGLFAPPPDPLPAAEAAE